MNTQEVLQGDKWLGHPFHPMLIPVPIGLWVFGSVLDIVASVSKAECVQKAADYSILGGIVGAATAAATGIAEYTRVDKGTDAQTDALEHGTLNVAALALNVVSSSIRTARRSSGKSGGFLPKFLSLASVGIITYTGWLGGKITYRHGIGVQIGKEKSQQKIREEKAQEKQERMREEAKVSM